jgi:hypothetical protein
MAISIGVQLERENALEDARAHIEEYGDDIEIFDRTESEVSRDPYGSIKHKDEIAALKMKAYPITYNPTDYQLFKAGIRAKVDCLIYTSMKDWNNYEYTEPYFVIDVARFTVKIQNRTYGIKEANNVNQFADTFLNIAIGLVRR